MSFEDQVEENKKIDAEEALAFGEIAPIDRLQNQIRLAEKMFEKFKGPLDREAFHADMMYRNSIMDFWSDGGTQSYSAFYRRMEDSDWFKNSPKLQGDIFKIEIADLLEYMEFERSPVETR